jgi:hypothetical protein
MGGMLAEHIDELVNYFNRRSMDLPDDLFARPTQFSVNGASFESLLSPTPNDPLVLMVARGAAGYRFIAKALQHAVPDAKLEKGDINASSSSYVVCQLRLSGHLRESGEPVNTTIEVLIKLAPAGWVETAEAMVDQATLDKLREARLR